MTTPLHKEAQNASNKTGFHAGLWYDRFFNQYDASWKVGDDGKKNWIKTVSGTPVGDISKLKTYIARQGKLINACGGKVRVMSTDWHFVTGMGNNHPVENGFAWHHTLGVPYLTGAAVKGMVRAWCEVWADGFDAGKLRCWFGPSQEDLKRGTDPAVGELIFFDALPVAPVKLKPDIMTPHYGDWYVRGDETQKSDGSNVPADWHDPVPVPFLVVAAGQSFQFAVAKRNTEEAGKIDLDEVVKELTNALQWLGAGAKTAAGYGRMQRNKVLEQQIKEQQAKEEEERKHQAEVDCKIAALGVSGLALEMVREAEREGWGLDKSRFIPKADEWLARMESESDGMMSACRWLSEKLEAFDPGVMVNPDKKHGKRQKDLYKPATRNLAHALIQHMKDNQ